MRYCGIVVLWSLWKLFPHPFRMGLWNVVLWYCGIVVAVEILLTPPPGGSGKCGIVVLWYCGLCEKARLDRTSSCRASVYRSVAVTTFKTHLYFDSDLFL